MSEFNEVEWKLLADLIQERFGLSFSGVRRDILESRLKPRLQELHLQTILEYYHYLRFHPDRELEFGTLARRITNNETYFFREPHHFDIITRQVIPPLAAELKRRPLRILSAGCSSGEEAYSLVISLQNAGLEFGGVTWEIDACDLNPLRIGQAREGVYEPTSLRACDDDAKRRYFDSRDGKYVLKPRHRTGVRFFESNLSSPQAGMGWGMYDVILCRNLLIYFSETSFNRLISVFARCLPPSGWLLLGHSESLIDRGTDFSPVCVEGAVVYRRGGGAA
jgi:chemotaxis protein methyltransferase CheR